MPAVNEPVRESWIKLAAPDLGHQELEIIEKVLSSGRLVRGEMVENFEEAVKNVAGVKFAISVNSGTTAIFAVLHALGIGRGDEVVLPSLSFPAAAECIVMLGATPVFVDVCRESFNIDPSQIECLITPRTKAVIAIDQFGVPADYDSLLEIVNRKGLVLVEDSACAIGAQYKSGWCGSFGKAAIFSFHPRKVITTGEGGMVLTDDRQLAESVRRLRNHGMDESGNFVQYGMNFRMNEIQAAIGLEQIKKLPEIIENRRKLYEFYRGRIGTLLQFQECKEGYRSTWQTVACVLKEECGSNLRNKIIEEMRKRKIELQVASFSASRLEPYKKYCIGRKFPVSEWIHNCGIALPAHSKMDEADAERVCNALNEILSDMSYRDI